MSVCCSPGHEDATFLPNCCVVSPQEIQDRIRIVELYAKDRQFADFVRQHQAWVALFAFTSSPKLGDEDSGRTGQQGREGPWRSIFTWRGLAKLGLKYDLFGWRWRLDAGAGVDLSLPRPPPAGPRGDTVRRQSRHCQQSGSASAPRLPPRSRVPDAVRTHSGPSCASK